MLLSIVLLYQINLAILFIISRQDVIVGCKSTNKILKPLIKIEKDYITPPDLTLFNQCYAFRQLFCW